MKLLFIRHGDPNYELDRLTERGHREAELLSERLIKLPIKAIYSSPQGRAYETCMHTAEKLGITPIVLPWIREFPPLINRPDVDHPWIVWDWLPEDWTKEPRFLSADTWMEPEVMANSEVPVLANKVCEGIDGILSEYGYKRVGKVYKTEKGNNDVLVFFCHFGVETLILSHLINASPMVMWHGFCAAPTAVIYCESEERRKGVVSWRINFGDLSHLPDADSNLNRSARFCGTYENEERHD